MSSERPVVKMYSDFKSPYAFLAFTPFFELSEKYDVTLKWIPFQLRIKGKGQRSIYSEMKVKYSYMDARRWSNRDQGGLVIRGPKKVYDSTISMIGGLFAEEQGRLPEYGAKVFELFFDHELEIDDEDQVAALIKSMGMSDEAFREYLADKGVKRFDEGMAESEGDSVFGVPMFIFNGAQYWGYDRMPLLEEHLTEAGLRISDRQTVRASG